MIRLKTKNLLLKYMPIFVLAAIILLLAIFWRHSPFHELTEQDKLQSLLADLQEKGWNPLLVYPIYIVAHFLLFPNVVLNAAVILTFGGFSGWLLAVTGSLCSASVFFFLGHKFGGHRLRHSKYARIAKLRRLLRKGGVPAVLSVRLVPIAPYPIVNSAAGAIHLRYLDFILGTFLAHLPGTVTLAFFGGQLKEVIRDPSPQNITVLVLIVAFGAFIIWVLKRWATDRSKTRKCD